MRTSSSTVDSLQSSSRARLDFDGYAGGRSSDMYAHNRHFRFPRLLAVFRFRLSLARRSGRAVMLPAAVRSARSSIICAAANPRWKARNLADTFRTNARGGRSAGLSSGSISIHVTMWVGSSRNLQLLMFGMLGDLALCVPKTQIRQYW